MCFVRIRSLSPVTFLNAMPVQQAMLRSVPFDQRNLALCVTWVFMRVLGELPKCPTCAYRVYAQAVYLACSRLAKHSTNSVHYGIVARATMSSCHVNDIVPIT
jgi:uncharacterized membrane protein